MCPDYKIPPVGDANGNVLQISSVVILHVRFGSTVFKAIFLIASFLIIEVLNATRFISRPVNSIGCIDRKVELTKGKIPLVGSASIEPTVKGLESMEDEYSRQKTDKQTKKMDYYHDIMLRKFFLCRHITPPP